MSSDDTPPIINLEPDLLVGFLDLGSIASLLATCRTMQDKRGNVSYIALQRFQRWKRYFNAEKTCCPSDAFPWLLKVVKMIRLCKTFSMDEQLMNELVVSREAVDIERKNELFGLTFPICSRLFALRIVYEDSVYMSLTEPSVSDDERFGYFPLNENKIRLSDDSQRKIQELYDIGATTTNDLTREQEFSIVSWLTQELQFSIVHAPKDISQTTPAIRLLDCSPFYPEDIGLHYPLQTSIKKLLGTDQDTMIFWKLDGNFMKNTNPHLYYEIGLVCDQTSILGIFFHKGEHDHGNLGYEYSRLPNYS